LKNCLELLFLENTKTALVEKNIYFNQKIYIFTLLSQFAFQTRNNMETNQTLVGDLCPEESKLSSLGKKLLNQKKKQLERTNAYEALLNSNQPKYVTHTSSQFIKFKKQQKKPSIYFYH
jgi:hypothetical protein